MNVLQTITAAAATAALKNSSWKTLITRMGEHSAKMRKLWTVKYSETQSF